MTSSTLSRPASELEDIILAYLSAVDAGQAPDRREFLNRHPQFASELAAFFADQDQTASDIAPLRNAGPAGTALPKSPSFGDYELLEEIARGGMGVVFKARQVSLNRVVALKMILAGHLASPADVLRFQTEAEMGARLDHPHIVPIYEVGEHEGQHYFSMKLMEGGSLAEQISSGRWQMDNHDRQRQAAQLIATIARTVEHAHQRGLLHRDLKPGNILFDLEGRAYVSDFGLCKHVPPAAMAGEPAPVASLTVSNMVIGTPSYMAPEQAASRRTVTTAADVYGLGAILYELLTGKVPFRADTVLETLHQVTNIEPPRPRSLNPTIDRDLETIALKCLDKEPRNRFDSAAALAEDLERWLGGEPIRARPAGVVERAVKWTKRRPASAALCALVAALLVAGVGALVWMGQAAEAAERAARLRAEKEAEDRRAETARADQEARDKRQLAIRLYFKNIALARLEFADNNHGRANELLEECDVGLRGWEWHFLDRYFRPAFTPLRQHTAGVVGMAFSADGRRLASVSSAKQHRLVHGSRGSWETKSQSGPAGAIRIFRTSDGREILRIDRKAELLFGVALSPDGKHVACSGSPDFDEPGFVKVFDTTSGTELLSITGHKDLVRGVAYSPDGRRLASASDDGMVKLWDAKSGNLLRTIGARDPSIRAVGAIAFSPDGTRLAGAIPYDCSVRVWDAGTGRELHALQGHTCNVTRVVFSPDGQRLATASEDHKVKVWASDTGRELVTLVGHAEGVAGVAFNPDGRRLVSAGYDHTARVWDSAGRLLSFPIAGHAAGVMDVAYSPDGERLATASLDGTIRIWGARRGHAIEAFRSADTASLGRLVYSPDGRHLAGRGSQRRGDVIVLDAATGKEVRTLRGHEMQLAALTYSPDGKRLASLSLDNTVRVWDTRAGETIRTLKLGGKPTGMVGSSGLAFSSDGKRIAAANRETVKVWDAATGRELHDFHQPADSVAFSPDGRRLALAFRNALAVCDADTGKEIYALKSSFDVVLFTPEGSRLIAQGSEGVKFLDAATGKEVMALRPRAGRRGDLAALSPDGRRLALVYGRNVIRLWDTSSGEEALVLPGHAANVVGLAFSPDGHRLASADIDGVVYVWDAKPRR
jgi:WD40 repeat protein